MEKKGEVIQVDNIYTALNSFQSEEIFIAKNTQGYGYKYANLGDTLNEIMPKLTKYGLCITQLINTVEEGTEIKTILYHSSGQALKSTFIIKLTDIHNQAKLSPMQNLGSAITYARRYTILAILCLASEDDDNSKDEPKTNYKKVNYTATAKKEDNTELILSIEKKILEKKITTEAFNGWLKKGFKVDNLNNLTKIQLNKVMVKLNQPAKKEKVITDDIV